MKNKISILIFEGVSVTRLEFTNCEVKLSGNHLIVSENEDDGVVSHVFELSNIKMYKTWQ